MTLRAAATWLFGFVFTAIAGGLISANVRNVAAKHGWDNFLIRGMEKFNWERLRHLWWFWTVFGLSGGIALALWLFPSLVVGPSVTTTAPAASTTVIPNPIHDEATKWRLVRNLHYLSSKTPEKCEGVIVRYEIPYSETYADDLKEVLSVIDWQISRSIRDGRATSRFIATIL